MKEAKEFGIKYLRTMPDNTQRFVMHQNIWTDPKKAEEMVESLKGVVACPTLVEIWHPDDICDLIEESEENARTCPKDCPGNSQKGKLPDESERTAEDQKIPGEVTDDPYCEKTITTYIGHPDGTVTVRVNGKDITDPKQQKKIREKFTTGFDSIFDNWLSRSFGGIDPKSRKDEKVEDPRDWRTFWPRWIVDFDNLPRYSC